MPIHYIPEDTLWFPPVCSANKDGILGMGGDLSVDRLLLAYKNGIFPWFNPDEPIFWWAPPQRMVYFLDDMYISKNMRKMLRQEPYTFTIDKAFRTVMAQCGVTKRKGQDGTWVTQAMLDAYCALHELGYAHSVEVWDGDVLVGGLYGVALGRYFCGESMFTHANNASKYGFYKFAAILKSQGFDFIDCQVHNDHLERLGAEEIDRSFFMKLLWIKQHETLHESDWNNWTLPILKST